MCLPPRVTARVGVWPPLHTGPEEGPVPWRDVVRPTQRLETSLVRARRWPWPGVSDPRAHACPPVITLFPVLSPVLLFARSAPEPQAGPTTSEQVSGPVPSPCGADLRAHRHQGPLLTVAAVWSHRC